MVDFTELENSRCGLFFFDPLEVCGYWVTENEGHEEGGKVPGWHVELCFYEPVEIDEDMYLSDVEQWEFVEDSTEIYRDWDDLMESWGSALTTMEYVDGHEVEFM